MKTCIKISLLEKTHNNRLFVSLNEVGTAHSLSTVIEFFNKRMAISRIIPEYLTKSRC